MESFVTANTVYGAWYEASQKHYQVDFLVQVLGKMIRKR